MRARRVASLVLLIALLASGLAPRPASSQPAATQPVSSQPAATQPVSSQPAASGESPPAAPGEAAPGDPKSNASAMRSAAKATTYKLGTIATNMIFLTAGTGIVGGTVLTVFNTVESWLVYMGNDYLWDKYAPGRVVRPDGSFDARESAWRTTEKFLTAKPIIAAFKYASVYVWTGSISAALVVGTISTGAAAGVFYLNNFAWDLYDWSQTPPVPVQTASP
jgi:hypothetical protein